MSDVGCLGVLHSAIPGTVHFLTHGTTEYSPRRFINTPDDLDSNLGARTLAVRSADIQFRYGWNTQVYCKGDLPLSNVLRGHAGSFSYVVT